jgi:hypothetical protein
MLPLIIFFKSAQDSPENAGAIATAKQRIGDIAQVTLGTAIGPVYSIIGLSLQVSLRIEAGNLI